MSNDGQQNQKRWKGQQQHVTVDNYSDSSKKPVLEIRFLVRSFRKETEPLFTLIPGD